ncbi:MAG: FHS family L-fucose permease-like MFS transporter [Flavobacteriales bacterium]|jgi:FHS family L-fucose permease-like MFS transporter
MKENKYLAPFIAVTTLFFIWGFITVLVDSLVPRLRELFELDLGTAALLQFAFFMAYFLISIPAGVLLSKIGYRKGMVLGLGTIAAGCFLYGPAAEMREFWLFGIAFFVVASGMAILQVAANPYVSVLGNPEGASSRLTLAQAFNSLGATVAPIFGAYYLLSDHLKSSDQISQLEAGEKAAYFAQEASAVQGPFYIIGGVLIVIMIFFLFVPLPQMLSGSVQGGFFKALKNKRLRDGAFAILFYVGVEVAISTFAVVYFVNKGLGPMVIESDFHGWLARLIHGDDLSGIDQKGLLGIFLALYWGGAMVGRFIGAYLIRVMKPALVLTLFGSTAIVLLLISAVSSGFVAMWALLLVGFFNSIMFPTIFTLAIDKLGDLKPQGSGILCSAIVGGAIIPPLYGYAAEWQGFEKSFIIFIICYSFIAFYAYRLLKGKYETSQS